jgi:hypothetical protein
MGEFAKSFFSKGFSSVGEKSENKEEKNTNDIDYFVFDPGEYFIGFCSDDDWISYKQHFSKFLNSFITCLGDECVICSGEIGEENIKKLMFPSYFSSSGLTYIFVFSNNKTSVKVLNLSYPNWKKIVPFKQKFGTLTNRIFNLTIIKEKNKSMDLTIYPEKESIFTDNDMAMFEKFKSEKPLDRFIGLKTKEKVLKALKV